MMHRKHVPLLLGVAAGLCALIGAAVFVFAPFFLTIEHPSTRPPIQPISLQHHLSLFFVLTHEPNPFSSALPLAVVPLITMLLITIAMLAAWRHTLRPSWGSVGILWATSMALTATLLSAYAGAGSVTQALLTPAYHFFALSFAPCVVCAGAAAAASLLVPRAAGAAGAATGHPAASRL